MKPKSAALSSINGRQARVTLRATKNTSLTLHRGSTRRHRYLRISKVFALVGTSGYIQCRIRHRGFPRHHPPLLRNRCRCEEAAIAESGSGGFFCPKRQATAWRFSAFTGWRWHTTISGGTKSAGRCRQMASRDSCSASERQISPKPAVLVTRSPDCLG